MIFAKPLTKADMPFLSKWATYYSNHKTDTLDCLLLSCAKVEEIDTVAKRNMWYFWYNRVQKYKNNVYIWYIIYEHNWKTNKTYKIGAVNFGGCVNECETLFFLIPKFRGKQLMHDGYMEAEQLLFDKFKVKYIWGETSNKGSAEVFEYNCFQRLGYINDYYKYTKDYYL